MGSRERSWFLRPNIRLLASTLKYPSSGLLFSFTFSPDSESLRRIICAVSEERTRTVTRKLPECKSYQTEMAEHWNNTYLPITVKQPRFYIEFVYID